MSRYPDDIDIRTFDFTPLHNQDKNIILEKGEYICNKCRGWGKLDYKLKSDIRYATYIPFIKVPGYVEESTFLCQICKGTGKVDWITNIFNN